MTRTALRSPGNREVYFHGGKPTVSYVNAPWGTGDHMSEIEHFSALVGEIYDASLDPSLWSSALEKISGFVPGVYANIFIQDANNRFANSIFHWGIDPVYFRSYLETYAKLNPAFPTAFFAEIGEVMSIYDFMDPDQILRSRFYREWATPQGVGDNIGAVLEKSASQMALNVALAWSP